ncbi:helix-turn-helix domain-containing protein [Catellatospora bangladeshensis]|uniref:helix-turn-helix domain-containing protein n=1 Tax=Catellatospora bangladeshensis TaxID=310355 RepID=UPI0036228337
MLSHRRVIHSPYRSGLSAMRIGVMDDEARLERQLGSLLQHERVRRGMSQEQLAARSGVPRQQITRFEGGRRAVTSTLADRLFGELGLQLRVAVEAAGSGLDAEIEKVRAGLSGRQSMVLADLRLLSTRHRPGFAYLLDGEGRRCCRGAGGGAAARSAGGGGRGGRAGRVDPAGGAAAIRRAVAGARMG